MDYYLISIQSKIITARHNYALNERLTVNHQKDMSLSLQMEDRLFLALQTEECVLPYEFSILNSNSSAHTLVICVVASYHQAIPLAAVSLLLSKSLNPHTYFQLTTQQVEAITSLMRILSLKEIPFPYQEHSYSQKSEIEQEEDESNDSTIFSEIDVLGSIENYICNRGYYFDKETLYNYHICLKTRPFAILAGLSGTGKSKLSQLYAEALGHRQHYLRLPVSPNWYNDQALLGYFDTISGQYITEEATDFIRRANDDTDNLYFLCLDEMNLAHVEHYFAQFLSAMEEDLEDRTIRLMSENMYQRVKNNDAEFQPVLHLPANLFFTGTINVDETTKSISDKVIDRANTIEFFTVDLEKAPQPAQITPISRRMPAHIWQSYVSKERDTTFRPQIIEISKILNRAGLGLGFRILHDIECYLANSKGLLEPIIAFDLQVKQRILPRIRGTEVIKKTIEDLHQFAQNNDLLRTADRLNEMKSRVQRDGYTSFWR